MNFPPAHDEPAFDDDAWHRLLAGEDVPDASAEDRAGARHLRTAFVLADEARAQAAAARPGGSPDPGLAWSRLRERARREGLLVGKQTPRERFIALVPRLPGAGSGRHALAGWGVVTGLVVLAIGAGVQWRLAGTGEVDVVRSASGVVTLKADHARNVQAAIEGALRAAGASASAYRRPGTLGIDVDWPTVRDAGVRAALARWHVEPPAGATSVRIEIADMD